MPITFHHSHGDGQHAKFQQWREAQQSGFVVSRKTLSAGMPHRADCKHMGDFFWKDDAFFQLARTG